MNKRNYYDKINVIIITCSIRDVFIAIHRDTITTLQLHEHFMNANFRQPISIVARTFEIVS